MKLAPLQGGIQSDFFEAALAAIHDAVYVFDRQHRFVYVNPAMQKLFVGIDLIGKKLQELAYPEKVATMTDNYLDQLFQTGEAVEDEVFYVTPEGRHAYFHFSLSAIRNTNGWVEFVIGSSRETTKRRIREDQSRERQQFLLKLNDALRPIAHPAAIQQTVTCMAMQYFKVDRCYYSEIIDGEAIIRCDASRPDLPSVAGTYPIGSMPMFSAIVEAGQPLVVEDANTSSMLDENLRAICCASQIISFVDVPVIKDGKVAGILCIINCAPRQWEALDIELAVAVAELTWITVTRAHTEAALRESEAQYRTKLETEVQERTAELEKSHNLLQATLDSSLDMIQVFRAVRDKQGKITDFIWILNNHTSEQMYGKVIGKSLLMNNPGVKKEQILKKFIEVTESGIPQQYERHYVHEQFDGWFYQSVVRLDDGVATSTANITERKRAELELERHRNLLQSIFDATFIQMSVLRAIRDADGHITDFRIMIVNKELERVTGRTDLVGKLYAKEYPGIRDAGLFDLIVKAIETGQPQQTEYFYPYEGFNKWFSCMFVKLDDGVVATNIDITDLRSAEEKIRRLEAEKQREVINVSMEMVEEERRRISESLHNGLGQLLYGIKISLASLNQEMPADEYKEAKHYTNHLLGEAINESRRISHELMPATLEEFGLQTAIEDICYQLQDGIHFTCRLKGRKERMEKYLELTVYRIVQELLTNVIKHAQATEATTEITVGKKQVSIHVSDNGRGISATQTHKPGIGLASIRSKIKLLNGHLNIHSDNSGTSVDVVIPVTEGAVRK